MITIIAPAVTKNVTRLCHHFRSSFLNTNILKNNVQIGVVTISDAESETVPKISEI